MILLAVWNLAWYSTLYYNTQLSSFAFIFKVKGIFTDSNNIFLWPRSEDIIKKMLFPKFKLILIFALQVTHDYVHWHCSTDYWVKLILGHKNLC